MYCNVRINSRNVILSKGGRFAGIRFMKLSPPRAFKNLIALRLSSVSGSVVALGEDKINASNSKRIVSGSFCVLLSRTSIHISSLSLERLVPWTPWRVVYISAMFASRNLKFFKVINDSVGQIIYKARITSLSRRGAGRVFKIAFRKDRADSTQVVDQPSLRWSLKSLKSAHDNVATPNSVGARI